MAALAVLRADWSPAIAKFLTAERDLAVTRAIVDKAGAVDGVTARSEPTVDGFPAEIHGALIDELRRIAWGAGGGLGSPPWKIPTRRRIPKSATPFAQLCLKFDGAYWRKLDRERGYPTEFVKALTEAGWLVDPDPRGVWRRGPRHLGRERRCWRRSSKAGCNAAACHAQMYIMGTRAAARQQGAEGALPAQDRQRRAAPAGVRRHRADQRHRHAERCAPRR